MTKSELIERVAQRQTQLAYRDIELAVKTILELMAQRLAGGDRIEIRGFGSFSLHYRPGRVGRNPKTGDPVSLPAKYVPHFKPGKELRERVDQAYRNGSPAGGHAGRDSGRDSDAPRGGEQSLHGGGEGVRALRVGESYS